MKTAKAQLSVEGKQKPDLRDGDVDIAGCVCRGSPHLRLISLGALKTWPPWSLYIQNAFLRAEASTARVFPALHPREIPRMVAGFGDCGHLRMALMPPQLRLIGPCASI